MTDIAELQKKRDGSALKVLADEGDHRAGIAFAQLVFDAKYAGDTTVAKTKKEAKEVAQADAVELLDRAYQAQHFDGMAAWADINFNGVREPGQFGSNLRPAYYSVAEEAYRALLEHPECPSNRRGEFLVGQAQAIRFKSAIRGTDRRDEAVALLEQATEAEDNQSLAHHILSGILWEEGQHEPAVTHAKACYEDYPFAALILQKAHEKGAGVDKSLEKAHWYYNYWEQKTQTKKKSKA